MTPIIRHHLTIALDNELGNRSTPQITSALRQRDRPWSGTVRAIAILAEHSSTYI